MSQQIPSTSPPLHEGSLASHLSTPTRELSDVLPPEVLQHVFWFASPLDCGDDPDREDVITAQATIVSCTRVCQSWRGAAFSQREVWATMVDVERQSIEALRHTLEISSPHPFVVGHRSAPVHLYVPLASAVLNLLCDYQARIRELHIGLRGYTDDDPAHVETIPLARQLARAMAGLQMPRLEALTWLQRWPDDPPPTDIFVHPHTDLPELKRVCISGVPALSACSALNLTELTIVSPYYRPTCLELMQFLQYTPNMQFLHLIDTVESDVRGAMLIRSFKAPKLTFPHLSVLNIDANNVYQMVWMMEILKSGLRGAPETTAFEIGFPMARQEDDFHRAYLENSVGRLIDESVPVGKTDLELHLLVLASEGICIISTILAAEPYNALHFTEGGSRAVLERLRALGGVRAWTVRTGIIGVERTIRLLRSVGHTVSSLKITPGYSVSNVREQTKLGQGLHQLVQITKITLVDLAACDMLPLLAMSPSVLRALSLKPLLPRLSHIELDVQDFMLESKCIQALGPALERRSADGKHIREVTFVRPCTCMDEVAELGERFGCQMSFKAGST